MDKVTIAASCPLCGGHEQVSYAAYPEFTWVKCSCGLIYKSSVAGGAPQQTLGGEGSFGESGYGRRYDARFRHRVRKSARQIADALAYLSPLSGEHTPALLDVGCSLGYTLEAAKRAQLTAVGVDISQVAVDHCRELGFTAEVAGLDRLPFPDQTFAVITMKHVLEHTIEPRKALQEMRRVLRPGGVLFIAVPNAGYRKAQDRPLSSRFFRPDAHGGIEHWIYYTPQTLTRLLDEEGFRVERVHPLLIHPKTGFEVRCVEALLWPVRAGLARALTALRMRKEFWLVASV